MWFDIHHSKTQIFQIRAVNTVSSIKKLVTFQGNLLNLPCVHACFFKPNKIKKSYMLIKSKCYVMCKFMCDEPLFFFFFGNWMCHLCTEEFVRCLYKGKKKYPNVLYCETYWSNSLCSFADKTYYGLPFYIHCITELLN
jgi:hypothetical protein